MQKPGNFTFIRKSKGLKEWIWNQNRPIYDSRKYNVIFLENNKEVEYYNPNRSTQSRLTE